jgi:hypothetical protein
VLCSGGQPGPGIAAGAAFDLPQQALIPSQVNQPGVPAVGDLLEHPGIGAPRDAGCAPAGLIDSQRHHRSRLLRQHRRGVVEKSRVNHRPGQAEVPHGLCHRPGPFADRASRHGAKPASHPLARGDLRYRLGERGPHTRRFLAPPPAFPPHQPCRHRKPNITPPGRHPPLHRRRGHAARDTPAVCPSSSRAPPGHRPDRPRTRSTTTSDNPNNNVVPFIHSRGSS